MNCIRLLTLVCVLCLFTAAASGQDAAPAPQRASRLVPVTAETAGANQIGPVNAAGAGTVPAGTAQTGLLKSKRKAYVQTGQLSQQPPPADNSVPPVPAKKHKRSSLRKNTDAKPVLSFIPAPETNVQPAAPAENRAEMQDARLTLLGFAFAIAVLGTAGVLYLVVRFRRPLKQVRAPKRPQPAAETRKSTIELPEPVAANSLQLAKNRPIHQPEFTERDEETPKHRGEVELALALQELKSKHQFKGLSKQAQKPVSAKKRLGQAKKLGTGIGELDLAIRLEKMNKIEEKEVQE